MCAKVKVFWPLMKVSTIAKRFKSINVDNVEKIDYASEKHYSIQVR